MTTKAQAISGTVYLAIRNSLRIANSQFATGSMGINGGTKIVTGTATNQKSRVLVGSDPVISG